MNLKVKVNSKPKVGKAKTAFPNINKGETVIESQLVKTVPHRNKYSLELNGNHIIINEPAVLVNHSCDPNC